jgi:hypothetical protein
MLRLSLFLLGLAVAVLADCWLAESGRLNQTLPELFPAIGRSVFVLGFCFGALFLLAVPVASLIWDRRIFRSVLASALICLASGGLLWEKQALGDFERIHQEWMSALQTGEGPYLYWCNAISIDAPQRLKNLIAKKPRDNWTVVLANNRGGSTEAMLTSYRMLTQMGVRRVIAAGQCDSACALLWSLMPERLLAPYAQLGFHGPYTASGLPARNHDLLVHLLSGAGMYADLARRLLAVGPADLKILDEGALRKTGLSFNSTGLLWIYRPIQCGNPREIWDGVFALGPAPPGGATR